MANKKIVIISLIFIAIISIILYVAFGRKKKIININCTLEKDNYSIVNTISLKDDNYYLDINYSYTYDNMNSVVDKYDSVNSYLNLLKKNMKMETDIKRDGYKLEYKMSGKLKDFNNNDLVSKEIEDLLDLKEIHDFKTYYEELNYVCD